jgi:hypothetical protein
MVCRSHLDHAVLTLCLDHIEMRKELMDPATNPDQLQSLSLGAQTTELSIIHSNVLDLEMKVKKRVLSE